MLERRKEIVMATTERFVVTGDQSLRIGRADTELKRQLYSQRDTKLNPEHVIATLQGMTEGKLTPFGSGLRGTFIHTMAVQIGGVSKSELIEQVKVARESGPYVEGMILCDQFTTLAEPEVALQILLSPADQGFAEVPTYEEFCDASRLAKWSRANFDGYVVELNSAEVGPHMAIQYTNQPDGEVVWIAMEAILDTNGHTSIFKVERIGDGGLWLYYDWVIPNNRINLADHFSFRLRKVA